MFNVNNKDTERRHWRHYGVFIVNFEHMFCSAFVFVIPLEICIFLQVLLIFANSNYLFVDFHKTEFWI